MTKYFLSPIAKEILIGPKSDTAFLEVFHYPPDKNQSLGHLFVVAQVLTDDEALSYVPNLLTSFLKREYYETSPEPTPQAQFEKALKKANELIYDLGENNNVKLNMAITVVAGDQLMASRVGRAKLLLAREGATTDVFSNVDLFGKTVVADREFSNILSGKTQEGDKLFFFIPNRKLSARENSIKTSLSKMEQDEFVSYIQNVNTAGITEENKTPFTCCAVHIRLSKEQEEIIPPSNTPVQLTAKPETEIPPPVVTIPNSAEIQRAQQKNIFKEMSISLARALPISKGRLPISSKYIFIGVLVIVALVLGVGIKNFISNRRAKSVLDKTLVQNQEAIKLAESKVILGSNKEAREILSASLENLLLLESSEDKERALKITSSEIERLDSVDPKIPEQLAAFEKSIETGLVISDESGVYTISGGKIEKFNPVGSKMEPFLNIDSTEQGKNALAYDKFFYLYDGQRLVWKISPAQKNVSSLTVALNEPAHDVKFYQDNLYILTSTITKISDFAKGQTQQQGWLKNQPDFEGISFVADQNIFVLTKDGKLLRYFKGEKIDDRAIDFPYSTQSYLYYLGADFVLVDHEQKKVRLMDSAGILRKTWNINNAGDIINNFFDQQRKTFYILSKNGLWKLEIEI